MPLVKLRVLYVGVGLIITVTLVVIPALIFVANPDISVSAVASLASWAETVADKAVTSDVPIL
jgi:hypothetical protein